MAATADFMRIPVDTLRIVGKLVDSHRLVSQSHVFFSFQESEDIDSEEQLMWQVLKSLNIYII